MTTDTITRQAASAGTDLKTRLDPYMAIIAPLSMIALIAAFMAIVEPTRYFRLSNLELILLESALYMPMAMAMTFVITQRGIDLSIGSVLPSVVSARRFLSRSTASRPGRACRSQSHLVPSWG